MRSRSARERAGGLNTTDLLQRGRADCRLPASRGGRVSKITAQPVIATTRIPGYRRAISRAFSGVSTQSGPNPPPSPLAPTCISSLTSWICSPSPSSWIPYFVFISCVLFLLAQQFCIVLGIQLGFFDAAGNFLPSTVGIGFGGLWRSEFPALPFGPPGVFDDFVDLPEPVAHDAGVKIFFSPVCVIYKHINCDLVSSCSVDGPILDVWCGFHTLFSAGAVSSGWSLLGYSFGDRPAISRSSFLAGHQAGHWRERLRPSPRFGFFRGRQPLGFSSRSSLRGHNILPLGLCQRVLSLFRNFYFTRNHHVGMAFAL